MNYFLKRMKAVMCEMFVKASQLIEVLILFKHCALHGGVFRGNANCKYKLECFSTISVYSDS